ncbi:MAG: DNA-binding transcriptional LysR family regulator [Planktomarina sp.]|jgi:DNA-binding transcriptional LysR family regulator
MENWDDLRIFLAVAQAGSLTIAAQVLKIDPATVSRRIARLEMAHTTPLFSKSPKGYELTEAGHGLVAHVDAAQSSFSAGLGALRGDGEGLMGQIRIGAPDGCANFLLPQVCGQITKDYPELDIQIVALPRVLNLTRREADMAIGVSQPTAGRLIVQKIADYRLHLAASVELWDKFKEPKILNDLRGLPTVGYVQDMIFDKELDYLEPLGLRRVQLASNSISVQMNLLRQGAGVGIVHDFALPFAPELRRILIDQLSLTRSFFLIRSADDRLNRRLNLFAEVLLSGIRTEILRLEALALA